MVAKKGILGIGLAVVGSIICGAAGSGLWDVFGGQIMEIASRYFLLAMSHIHHSVIDEIYVEVAKGHHERRTIDLYFFSIMAGIAAPGIAYITLAIFVDMIREERNTREDIGSKAGEIKSALHAEHGAPQSENRPRRTQKSRKPRQDKPTQEQPPRNTYQGVFLSCVALFLVALMMYQVVRVDIVNRSVTGFNQLFAVCAPFISDETEEKIKSSFARINSKADYDDVMKYMRTVLKNVEGDGTVGFVMNGRGLSLDSIADEIRALQTVLEEALKPRDLQ